MPRYAVWVDETITKKIYFDADSKEHAIELMNDAGDWEEDLPSFNAKTKDYHLDADYSTLEELN